MHFSPLNFKCEAHWGLFLLSSNNLRWWWPSTSDLHRKILRE
jgi:hypothetical protein